MLLPRSHRVSHCPFANPSHRHHCCQHTNASPCASSHFFTGIRSWIPSVNDLLGFTSFAYSRRRGCAPRHQCYCGRADDIDSQGALYCYPNSNFGSHNLYDPTTESVSPGKGAVATLQAREIVPRRQEQRYIQQQLHSQAQEIASLRRLVNTLTEAMQRCNSRNFDLQMTQDGKNCIGKGNDPRLHISEEENVQWRRTDADEGYDYSWQLTGDLERIRDLLLVVLVKVKDLESKVRRIPELEEMNAQFLQSVSKQDNLTDAEGSPSSKKPLDKSGNGKHHDCQTIVSQHSSDIPNDVTDSCDEMGHSENQQLREELALLQKHWEDAEKEWEDERFVLLEELERRRQEMEEQEVDLNLLEEERDKYRQHETKVKDILKVLKNLKLLNLPHRTLGKLLLQSLSACRDQSRPENHVRNFLEQFYQNLLGCELLHTNSLLPLALQMGNGE